MIEYVIGLMFSSDLKRVALILRNRPTAQAGLLNGVNGKIKPGVETPHEAMAREFWEETGMDTKPDSWQSFATLKGTDVDSRLKNPSSWKAHVFTRVGPLRALHSTTDEQIIVVHARKLAAYRTVVAVDVLIALAFKHHNSPQDSPKHTTIEY